MRAMPSSASTATDHFLLPGEFVVDRAGVIRLAYRYQYCEDFPNPLVLTTAIQLTALKAGRQPAESTETVDGPAVH
jgi:hypothetical protein